VSLVLVMAPRPCSGGEAVAEDEEALVKVDGGVLGIEVGAATDGAGELVAAVEPVPGAAAPALSDRAFET